jgi:hypothetical protein
MLAVWLFVLPGGMFFFLKKNRESDCWLVLEGYETQYYYWEFLVMLRKYLVIISAILIQDLKSLVVSMLVLVLVYTSLLLHLQPYVNGRNV